MDIKQSKLFDDVTYPCVLSGWYKAPDIAIPWKPIKGINCILINCDDELEAYMYKFDQICSYDGFDYDFKLEVHIRADNYRTRLLKYVAADG